MANNWITLGHDEKRTFCSDGNIPGTLSLLWAYNTPLTGIQTEDYTSNLLATTDAIYIHFADLGNSNSRIDKVNPLGSRIWSSQVGINSDNRMHMNKGDMNLYPAGTSTRIMIMEDGGFFVDDTTGSRYFIGEIDLWGNILQVPGETTAFYCNNVLTLDGDSVFLKKMNPLYARLAPGFQIWQQNHFVGTGVACAQDYNGGALAYENGVIYNAVRYHFLDNVQHIANGVYAFNSTTGSQIFAQATTPTSPLSIGTYLYCTENNNLVARNKTTGAVVWSQALTGQVFTATPIRGEDGLWCMQSPVVVGTTVIVGTRGGIFAFNQSTGAPVWSNTSVIGMERSIKGTQQYQQLFTFMAAASTSNTLVVCGSDNNVYVLSVATGNVVWSGRPVEPTWYLSNPVIVGNMVYIADGGGHMIALQSGGSGTRTIVSTLWEQIGTTLNVANIQTPHALTSIASGLIAGNYQFKLTATDNGGLSGYDYVNIIVLPAPAGPTANAGSDQSITLPTNSVSLVGIGSGGSGGYTYSWAKISGPSTFTINSPTSASTSFSGLVEGAYVLQFRVTDSNGLQNSDTVQITVNPSVPPPVNLPPTVNPGSTINITLPTTTCNLNGTASDSDGTISSWVWSFISGPATPVIQTTSAIGLAQATVNAMTFVTGLNVAGTYQFRLTATDDGGASTSANILVIVSPPIIVNQPPIANAGFNQTIPSGGTALLNGSQSNDPDGTIVAWSWTQISGPTSTIPNSNSAATSLPLTTAGTYIYNLLITDNGGLQANAQVTINVLPAPSESVTLTVTKKVIKGKTTDILAWNISLFTTAQGAELQVSTVVGDTAFATFWIMNPYVTIGTYPEPAITKKTRYYRVKVIKADGTPIYSNIFPIR